MINTERSTGIVVGGFINAPLFAAAGAFTGYSYARLAAFPVHQAALAYSIWFLAQHTLFNLSKVLIKERSRRLFTQSICLFICSAKGIQELRKMNLIGNKMAGLVMTCTTLSTLALLTSSLIHESELDI